ncbi:Calcitonin gene-related peptide type 1 receptor [Larimichthys crocea]|uniref:Calcitonin gene-related peptide type 1 receptor n=2 Tax=Sciaenidae TaxID=30870 RepID=A0A6G0IP52_LARCR|nr:calcitonin gene-related peptide type 1 receptor [Larimichthys crocea]KAE8293134.1 Calcitonin gene-related peptide type 1 receptor [Larimichthys crocea]
MGIFGGKDILTAHSKRRNMWRTLTLSLIVALTLGTEVSQAEDVGSMGAVEMLDEEQLYNFSDISSVLGKSRHQIMAAQFECYLKIIHDPPRTEEGSYCNRTWDGWLCWGDSAPGTVMQMCPSYFVDFDPAEKVTKVCHADGQWFHHPESNRVWSNYTQCQAHTKDKLKFTISLFYLAMVGNSLSIVSLIISLIIFSYFKSLSCQRISLHKNTFLSFILNSIVRIMWLSLSMANTQTMNASNPVSCKVLAVLTQYTLMSNHFWMLCEGIYLHTLIIVAVFVGEQQLFWYYVLGWGFPIIPAITYAVARGLFFNDLCWFSADTQLLYIIHGPIHVALLVNFFFLLNILRVLITKLKETHCTESTAYLKAVRATLILIPLLGVQFILLPWRPDERIRRAIFEFTVNILAHFQGLLVAIIFCFCNAEAQTALKRKWAQWKSAWGKTSWGDMPITNNHFNYHSSSITETSRATISLEHPDAPSEQNSHVLFKERKNTNGQQKDSKTCSNGEVDMLNKMETTNDGGDGCGAKHHLYVDAERQETQKTELAGEFS